jgi:hypothetical protein
MTDTTPAEPLRIPIGRNVTYAVRGMPPVANAYGPGFLVPTEVSLTYRAAEDSQLGRFHAYVKGQWLRDGEVVPSGEKLPGQHYNGDPANWPEWLAEEARLHDPDAAASAPVSPAPADRAALSARLWAVAEHNIIAEWICCEPIKPKHDLCVQGEATRQMVKALLVDDPEAARPAPHLDAVLAVPPEPTDRAAILREAAAWFDRYDVDSARELRRLAAAASGPGGVAGETPQPEGEPEACTCAAGGDCFAPAGHYADCPQAAPAAVSQSAGEA